LRRFIHLTGSFLGVRRIEFERVILRKSQRWSTILVTIGYLTATLTGFVRQSVLALYLGAGRETDIFFVAFSIPELFLIALPIVLSPVVIPLFARVRQQASEQAAARLVRRLLAWMTLFFLGGVLILWIFAPVYIPWLSPGFTPVEQGKAAALARQMLPAIVLMGASALAGAILQVYRSFARPAFVTALYNLVFAGCLLLLPGPAIHRAAWAVSIGSLSTLLVQLPLMARLLAAADAEKPGREVPGAQPVSALQVLGLILPFAAGYGVHHVILLIDRAMATTLGWGDAAALSYARNLSLVIVQVSGLAVSTVMFPGLAEQMDRQAYERARANLLAALRWVWAVAAPATAVMVVLREPLVRFLFERGAFDSEATASVSLLLAVYAVAALADALCQPLWRVVYAQGSPWAVLGINLLQTVVRFGANLLWIPSLHVLGLALSAVLGLSVQALVLAGLGAARLHVKPGDLLERGWLRGAGWVMLAAALAAALAGLLASLLQHSFPAAGLLLVAGGGGAAVYAAVMWRFGDARSIWRGIKAI